MVKENRHCNDILVCVVQCFFSKKIHRVRAMLKFVKGLLKCHISISNYKASSYKNYRYIFTLLNLFCIIICIFFSCLKIHGLWTTCWTFPHSPKTINNFPIKVYTFWKLIKFPTKKGSFVITLFEIRNVRPTKDFEF